MTLNTATAAKSDEASMNLSQDSDDAPAKAQERRV